MFSLPRLLTLTVALVFTHGLCAAQARVRKAVSAPTPVAVSTAAAAAAPAAPQPNVHEQQLQAIRQALIEATAGAPTQVISTSWIDDMGALRESQQYNSKAEVRHIRLLPWIPSETSEDKPKATAEVLPWGWRGQAPDRQAASCEPPPRVWRTPLELTVKLAPGFPGEQQAAGKALVLALQQQFNALVQQGQRWTPEERQPAIDNTYLRALLAAPRQEASGWQAQLVLEPAQVNTTVAGRTAPVDPQPWASWMGTRPWVWNLHLSLHSRQSGADAPTRWQQDWRLTVDADQAVQQPSRWQPAMQSELSARLADWLAHIESSTRCEPAQFAVHSEGGRALRLMAGQHSGLRSGDRVLVMQPGWVPSRMFDEQAANHLALAEVVRIGARQTEIRQLAGPPLPPGGQWVALPL